jgi:hypothetical protein
MNPVVGSVVIYESGQGGFAAADCRAFCGKMPLLRILPTPAKMTAARRQSLLALYTAVCAIRT